MATLPNINNAGPRMPEEDFGKSEREKENSCYFILDKRGQFTRLRIKTLICQ